MQSNENRKTPWASSHVFKIMHSKIEIIWEITRANIKTITYNLDSNMTYPIKIISMQFTFCSIRASERAIPNKLCHIYDDDLYCCSIDIISYAECLLIIVFLVLHVTRWAVRLALCAVWLTKNHNNIIHLNASKIKTIISKSTCQFKWKL